MIIALDTETHLIKPGMLTPKLVCVSLAYRRAGDISTQLLLEGPGVIAFERHLKTDIIVCHNAPFDIAVLLNTAPQLLGPILKAYDEGRIKCTQIRERLLNNAEGLLTFSADGKKQTYSLASLVEKNFGRIVEKKETYRLRYNELDGVPLESWPHEAKDYALLDAVEALNLYERQEERTKNGAIADEDNQQRAGFWLHLCSVYGLRTDGEKVRALRNELQKEVDLEWPLVVAGGFVRKDGTKDSKKIHEVIESTVPGVARTPTGKPNSSQETLLASTNPGLNALGRVGRAKKLLSTYIPVLEEGSKAPICARYTSVVETGRTACSAPNVQNQPSFPGVRECFVPRPGYVYVDVDYDTLELRALAQVCLDKFHKSKMAEAVRAGRDLHTAFAAQLLSRSYEETLKWVKEGEEDCKKARKIAKVFNFGLPGGMGAKKFVEYAALQGLSINESDFKKYKATWLKTFPEMSLYFEYISGLTAGKRATLGPPLLPITRGGLNYSECANTLFQGRAAAGAKEAGWLLTKACFSPGVLRGAHVVAFIHDEFILEVPEGNAEKALEEVSRIMCSGMAKYIPDVPITASGKIMKYWSK